MVHGLLGDHLLHLWCDGRAKIQHSEPSKTVDINFLLFSVLKFCISFVSLLPFFLQNHCGSLRNRVLDHRQNTLWAFCPAAFSIWRKQALLLFAVAGCHAACKSGTSEQLLWIRDGIQHTKEKWYSCINNWEPHNGPLNQLVCSSHCLWVAWVYLVHAAIESKVKKITKKENLLHSRLCRSILWASCLCPNYIRTFVYPCSYLFIFVLAPVARNCSSSLCKGNHVIAQLFCTSTVWFIFISFLQVAYSTLSSLSFHYLWTAAVIYINEIIAFALLAV